MGENEECWSVYRWRNVVAETGNVVDETGNFVAEKGYFGAKRWW